MSLRALHDELDDYDPECACEPASPHESAAKQILIAVASATLGALLTPLATAAGKAAGHLLLERLEQLREPAPPPPPPQRKRRR